MPYTSENIVFVAYENGHNLLVVWIFTILTALAVIIGFHLYVSVKKRFDAEYKAEKVLWRRIIHGIVYFIFVILAYEAVTIRFKGEIARIALFFIYLCLSIFALFIFGDMLISIYKVVKK